ncbi:MAG: zinc ribbon domain-containing protein [Anaerolineae bacterium]|nr:zinc ribbon domain-containing protein [Anaerolineae bacterium]
MNFPIGTLLLGLALLIVLALIVALPLFDRKTPVVRPPSRREALEAERRAVIHSIRELDFDFRTNKISEADYRALRAALVQRGAEVLRALEALEERDVDAEIEARVAQLRETREATPVPANGRVCSGCGALLPSGARFCPSCGQPVAHSPTGVQAK